MGGGKPLIGDAPGGVFLACFLGDLPFFFTGGIVSRLPLAPGDAAGCVREGEGDGQRPQTEEDPQ